MLKINEFTVEYQKNPLGLDEIAPRFSWIMFSSNQCVVQLSYRLLVSNGGSAVWDSGELQCADSVLVEYGGQMLLPRTQYTVQVWVGDNCGETATKTLCFETGLLGGVNLKGKFIALAKDYGNVVPLFCRKFKLEKTIKQARIYATALGVYEMHINGSRVSNLYNAPYWTSYNNRLQYQTYDVTHMLANNNAIEVAVANGWYKGYVGYYKQKNYYGSKAAFCADIYIDYADGSSEVISTDTLWTVKQSQIRESEFFDGELIDTTFSTSNENKVLTVDYDKLKIIAQISEPVRVIERVAAKKLITTQKKETVIDFGQNLTGIVEFKVTGKIGEKLIFNYAEVLDKKGNFYTENLRTAKCKDTFILNGTSQILKPHFTFHGFRYLKISGNSFGIDINNFNVLVLHSDMEKTGQFDCSDLLIRQLQSNIMWGQKSNFFDVPTDCPQRDERLGWTGDAQVFCRTAMYNYNTALFFKKWLGDLKAEQSVEKGVPHIIPNVIAENDKGTACWGDAATVIPWTLYTVYGDKRLLSEQFSSMASWVDYIHSCSIGFLWKSGFQYGDWLALDKEEFSDRTGATDKYLIASAFFAYSTYLTASAAKVLGKDKEYEKYNALYSKIVNAFRDEYITKTGRVVSETQTAYVLLLYFNLIQDEFRCKAANALKDNIFSHNNHLVTGFVGTPFISHVLSENGLHDLATKLLFNDDYPSWLYQVKMGATTIWERWNGILPSGDMFDPAMNSFNHYAYGSIGDWLYRKVGGIDCLDPGYKKILIKPYLVKGIDWVNATFKSAYGEVGISYICDKNNINYKVTIPVNTTAIIQLEDSPPQTIGSGIHEFSIKAKKNLLLEASI